MTENDERNLSKVHFDVEYKNYFTEYTDFDKIIKNVKSYKYLVDQLRKLDSNFNELDYKHVMSKKKLLSSKNAKKMCRNGIPIKYMRNILLKMFNINFSKENFENKKKESLRGIDINKLNQTVPTFTNKFFKDSLPKNYLNEKGIESLKEILWCLNIVIGPIEYSPLIIKVTSIILLFLSKEETYDLMRHLLEINFYIPQDELMKIRWQFRFTYNDYLKIKYAIDKSIIDLSNQDIVKRFKNLTNLGYNRINLIEDMTEGFFLDYINFPGIIKLLPIFLYEGEKIIYRLCYGIISMTIYNSKEKKTQEEFLKTYKEYTNKIDNYFYLFDISFKWNLTHFTNHFVDILIPKYEKDKKIYFDKYYYIPKLTPDSKILTQEELAKIWCYLPLNIKLVDGKILLNKKISPESDLNSLIDICEKFDNNSTILFIIETEKNEIFGGLMTHNIYLNKNGHYDIPKNSFLISVKPNLKVYSPKNLNENEIILIEPGALRFGFGENGPAISIFKDLNIGWSFDNSVFGNVKLVFDEGSFNIKNFEVYLMQ